MSRVTVEMIIRAGRNGFLPDDFEQWDLTDKNGWTVAEIVFLAEKSSPTLRAAAQTWLIQNLPQALEPAPENFDAAIARAKAGPQAASFPWGMSNFAGKTVAHIAAKYGTLPAHFKHWDWTDKHGRTVAQEAARYGNLPADFDQWELAEIAISDDF
jgi:hypothetical protein